ncbi:hypothetical protein A3A79_04040 [Candidatus Gottesmanbacteria bacterium RIFCSPLOWO2_01_FULL_43_11b]|uniref:SpoVT-AbrB domain-containing protein n=1 Tax=Candidatus Gottesmanbacteria bacterium RIFCSPLOWO2_01_FULL_43_11b TaxID=1798392 RepID=A0A1F6AJ70_9BACT|nr:MAG: hypothetical protein A3A79_04040 [Candidatus Gottesmanbacteria bacterium RIFCSPLOWO2_01_FULL_43_11b]
MTQKVLRTGNSIAVVIPSKFARDVAIKPGDPVHVSSDRKRGKITYTFANVTQLSLLNSPSRKLQY